MSAPLVQDGDRCGWPQVILFDLDGTLIDSAPDIRTATNKLLAEEGHDALSLPDIRSMIGNGIKKLVERAFKARGVDLEGDALETMNARMMAIYADHLTIETSLMPGAQAMIDAYHAAGVKLGVVTNKPEAFSREIIAHFGLDEKVAIVVGGDTCQNRKPHPEMLLHASKEAGFSESRTLMVGDSPADIDAAKAAAMVSVAVRGGYTNVPVEELGANIVIDSLNELPGAIETLKEPA